MPPWVQLVIPHAMSGSLNRCSMTLFEMRNAYRSSLSFLYGQHEIDDIFKRVIAFYFDWSPLKVGMEPNALLQEEALATLLRVKAALQEAKPLQYVLGETHFAGMQLKVTPAVLIPRPETEELIRWVLTENETKVDVWDLCTGSGCVALAIKKARPNWNITGVDISSSALDLAKTNTEHLNVDISFIEHDLLTWNPQETVDLIVANPPYVLPSEKQHMHPNILEFEPSLALFVPEKDPLLFYRAILTLGRKALNPQGAIYFEINPLCVAELIALGKTLGYVHSIVKKDIFGKERFVKFSR